MKFEKISLGKLNIHKRILLMLLSAVFLTFAALGVVSLRGLFGVRHYTEAGSMRLGDDAADYAEDMAIERTKKRIAASAAEKARKVENELKLIRHDTEVLAEVMTRVLTHPENYSPRRLPVPTEKHVAPGEAYLLVASKVREECASDEVQREIALASNAVDELEVMAKFYMNYKTSCYYGSKYGYYITLECYDSEEMYKNIHSESYHNNYDPRTRPWYQLAAAEGKTVFTDVYVSDDGYLEITCAVPYYDTDGIAGVTGLDAHLDSLYQLMADRSLGKSNSSFVLNSRGEIVLSSETEGELAVGDGHRDLRRSEEEGLALEAAAMARGLSDVVPVTLNGEEYYLAYAPVPSVGWSYGTLLKKEEMLRPVTAAREMIFSHAEAFSASMRSLFLENTLKTGLLLAVLFILFFYGSRKMAQRFVEPILALTEGVRGIAKGDLDKKLDIRTGDEIEELSDSINRMTSDLKDYMANLSSVTAEKEKIATELSLAESIQKGMLPNIFPKFAGNPHYDLFATMDAAKEVGGDFYDFYNLDDFHVAFTIADVSGKGVPAALFMMLSKTMLKNDALMAVLETDPENIDWAKVLEQVNRQLCENNEEMMFVTVFFAILNIKTGRLIYVNGGHNPPLVGRVAAGRVSWEYIRDEKKSNMVGVIETASYEEKQMNLSPGEMLFFYTDGVTEAMNKDKELYSEERLQATLNREGTSSAVVKDILVAVRDDIDTHADGAEQSDDITMVGIRFLG